MSENQITSVSILKIEENIKIIVILNNIDTCMEIVSLRVYN